MPIDWTDAVDESGNATREFQFELEQGQRLVTGAIWLPKVPGSTLICFGHGASGDRYQTPISHLAGRFVAAGYACLSVDGPVHGLRSVGDGARGAFFPHYQRQSTVDEVTEDWQASIELAKDTAGTSDIAYFGLSMGSIFGIPLLGSRKDLRVATLGLLGVTDTFPHGSEILEAAAKIECPILYLMQLEDELFDRDGYLRVFDTLASNDKRLHANPGLHPAVPDEEIGFAYDFMLDVIEGRHESSRINLLAE